MRTRSTRNGYVLALVAVALVLAGSGMLLADTLYVPSGYPTIQAAIDGAINGDEVVVADGTYTGDGNRDIDFLGKAIVVRSKSGNPAACIIDCQGSETDPHRGFHFHNGETSTSVVDGFTIRNGWGASFFSGSGVLCDDAGPMITNCIITGNSTPQYGYGGGICCFDPFADATIINCVISNNSALTGGGVHCDQSCKPTIINCTISGNSALRGGGIGCMFTSNPTVINCVMSGNQAEYGGALYAGSWAGLAVFNCTITGNSAVKDGGAISCMEGGATMRNCILWANEPKEMGGYCGVVATYCDIDGGWPGQCNIDVDPLFLDPANDDYHLIWLSPCINMGTKDGAPLEDFDGDPRPYMGTVDIGADEFTGTHPMEADVFDLSEATGGAVSFYLNGGTGNANRDYLVLGSFTGTAPGTPLPGGTATLPLNWDFFTNLGIAFANTPIFVDFLGTLDPTGNGSAVFSTGPMPPGLAGSTLSFAYTLCGPCWDFASNPINIEIVP